MQREEHELQAKYHVVNHMDSPPTLSSPRYNIYIQFDTLTILGIVKVQSFVEAESVTRHPPPRKREIQRSRAYKSGSEQWCQYNMTCRKLECRQRKLQSRVNPDLGPRASDSSSVCGMDVVLDTDVPVLLTRYLREPSTVVGPKRILWLYSCSACPIIKCDNALSESPVTFMHKVRW